MSDLWDDGPESLSMALADAVNSWLREMIRNITPYETSGNRLHIGVLGYRTDMEAQPIIESLLLREQSVDGLAGLSDIAAHPQRFDRVTPSAENAESGDIREAAVELPAWVSPTGEGGKPTCSALLKAYDLMEAWTGEHPNSFPPLVVNITDGESQEGDLLPYADPITDLETNEGHVQLWNCHLVNRGLLELRGENVDPPILFPGSQKGLPDDLAGMLYEVSSTLSERLRERLSTDNFSLQAGARGLAYNADRSTLIRFLNAVSQSIFGMI
jgi:hypothetical protein